jgi:hypothetical protein
VLVLFPSLLLGLVVYVLVLSGKKVRTLYQTHPLSGEDDEKEEGVSDARSALNAGRINEPVKGTETELGEESRQSEVVRGEPVCGGEVKTSDEEVRCRELGGGGRGCVGVPMSLARERQAYRDAMLAKGLVEGSDSESYLEEFRPVCESALSSMQDGEGGVGLSSSCGDVGGGKFESSFLELGRLQERLGGSSEAEEGGQLDWSDGSDEEWQACGSCSEESKSNSDIEDEGEAAISDSSSSEDSTGDGEDCSVSDSSIEIEIREVSLVDYSSQGSIV